MSAIWRRHRRCWGDNDHYLGPLTYARDGRGWRPLAVVLASGCDEYPGASFRVSGFGHTVILALPPWALRPYREKVPVCNRGYSPDAVARPGRDWYWRIDSREYGFCLSEGHLSVSLGRQSMDSSTEQRWGCFLPWTQWRFVRSSFYGLQGEHLATIARSRRGRQWRLQWEEEQKLKDATPTAVFDFDDFDGERITATTRMEEGEWRFGTGWFKWLSWFRRPRIRRHLDLQFSAEVGRRKGSWKGGTRGHAIEMRPGELHEAAFRRYCAENELTFVGPAAERA